MIDIGTAATLACIWEATAPKPGNVYRGADFDDVTYADFLTSAAMLGPKMALASTHGVGTAIFESIRAIHHAVGTNTYLGTVLLLAPLAAISPENPVEVGLSAVLENLSGDDTQLVYEAIRLAEPGGLGKVSEADVRSPAPKITLVEAMRLAADRDLVARQFTNGFAQVFAAAEHLENMSGSLSERIVRAFMQLLAEIPDTLIARKCGMETAKESSHRAAKVLTLTGNDYRAALADLDFWLRSDGHRRNPGTSADIIAAALFVLLRDDRLKWPVKFY